MKLVHSGLPLDLNETDYTLTFCDGLLHEETSGKTVSKLSNVLAQPEYASEETAFRFYKGIHFANDQAILDKCSLRYDITLILPGLVGEERKKTTGHFHKLLKGSKYSHAELYEVIYGTALYILQPIKDMSKTGADMEVDDVILVKLNAGEKIVVPANCSHCTVNAGDGALVFSNLVLGSGSNDYGGIGMRSGMGVYIFEKDGKLEVVRNPKYDFTKTKVSKGKVAPDENLGTVPGKPVYNSFIENPDKFSYLKDPEKYIEEINRGLTVV